MARSGTTTRRQKDTCLKDIGLHAQNMMTSLCLMANIHAFWGGCGGSMQPFDEDESLPFVME